MADHVLSVSAGIGALAGLTRNPVRGICELIWNAFDEDARVVTVSVETNDMGGLDLIVVEDDGGGMTPERIDLAFGRFGDSWKQTKFTTDGGRTVHGSKGQGRFAAFSLGEEVAWTSTAARITGDGLGTTRIAGRRSSMNQFDVSESETRSSAGTRVEVGLPTKEAQDLIDDPEGLRSAVAAEFALHLKRHTDFQISVLGQPVNPDELIERTIDVDVPLADGLAGSASLTVILWKIGKVPRHLYFCSSDGAVLADLAPRVNAPTLDFTAYLTWSELDKESADHSLFSDDDSDSPVGQVLKSGRQALREKLQEYAREAESRTVKRWQAEGAHPWRSAPQTPVEVAKYDTFNVVAMAASRTIDEIKNPKQKKLVLRLLKETVESDPESVVSIMQEVVRLPSPRLEELQQLLERTSLSQIIQASKEVGNRVDFLNGLSDILFEKQFKKRLLERKQLHRILANETWVFGEEWSLTGDDERLSRVLKKFLTLLGENVELATDKAEILTDDGQIMVPDLVLGRAMESGKDEWDLLVVELKRPSHTLNDDDLSQIRKYATKITGDELFDQPNAHWTFWLVGNTTSDSVDHQRSQRGMPYGVVQDSDKFRIYVKTWAEILSDCQYRTKFIQDSLQYESSGDQGLAFMRQRYAQYLPSIDTAAPDPQAGATDDDSDLDDDEVGESA